MISILNLVLRKYEYSQILPEDYQPSIGDIVSWFKSNEKEWHWEIIKLEEKDIILKNMKTGVTSFCTYSDLKPNMPCYFFGTSLDT
jgi:hypothetical protein